MMRTPSLMTVDARDMAVYPQRTAVPGRAGVCRHRSSVSAKQRTTVAAERRKRGPTASSAPPAPTARPRRSARDRADLVVSALALLELDQPFALRVSEQLGEVAITVVALREIRI